MTSVDFLGESFETPDEIDAFSWWEFCEFAADGASSTSPEGMGALSRLVKSCVRAEDMPRWRKLQAKHRPSTEVLMEFVAKVMASPAEVPTVQPSASADGLSSTEPSSVSSVDVPASPASSGPLDRALARYEGRPDIQAGFLRQEQQQRLRSVS